MLLLYDERTFEFGLSVILLCAERIGIMERHISERLLILVTVLLLAVLNDTEAQHDFFKMPGVNKCVALIAIQSNWTDAQTYCGSISAQLGVIRSQEEQDFYSSILYRKLYSYWIQMNDLAVEGVFTYPNGDPINYTAWAPGEPNADGDCVRVMAYKLYTTPPELLVNGSHWTDKPCSNLYYSACEKEDDGSCFDYFTTTTVSTTTGLTTTVTEPSTTTVTESSTTDLTSTVTDPSDQPISQTQSNAIIASALVYVAVPALLVSLIVCRYCCGLGGGKRRSRSPSEEEEELQT